MLYAVVTVLAAHRPERHGVDERIPHFSMKWGIFDEGTKSTGERGSGRIYKNVAEFSIIASEGVLPLQEWKIFCTFVLSFSTQDYKKVCKMKNESEQQLKRNSVVCPKCGRQTSFNLIQDAIDEEGGPPIRGRSL